jgi:peptidoglycan/xylan/chitin deacetylase (PgdA/CDA1 family)
MVLPQLIWNKTREDKMVYLTFDDGPHPTITPWVLKELDKVNAKATFFVVGENALKFPETMDLIRSKGHTIGNHTQHHIKGWNVSAKEYIEDILACEESIGVNGLFRPPYGRINFKSISLLKSYDIVMWDLLSKDYLPGLDTAKSLKRMKKKTNGGTIAVFHDSAKAETNLKVMLPEYLQFLNQSGYAMNSL